jgi:histone-lysine N-methyltransferase EZH2
MKPIQPIPVLEGSKTTEVFARLTVEAFNASGGKAQSRRCFDLPCTMYHTPTDADVPNYSHFVNIKHSFLAQNETVLQHWPYFHDDFDMKDAKELEEQYYLDVKGRERKLKRLAQAENYAEYVEDMLRDIGCAWSDVLRFLLDPEPDVGTNPQALAALRARDRFCDEDFVRGGQRWTTVLSKLPLSIDPERVGKAALFCEHFQKIAKFQLWHVARRSDYTAKLLKEEEKPRPDLDEITCRVCMRFCCPDHGEIHENPSGGSDSERDGSADEDVVETDIIHPYRVNYRSRVSLPSTVDNVEPGTPTEIEPKRKRVEYWLKQNLNHYPDDRRGPFYPCHHPGKTCDKVRCSCFLNRIPCEKSCACPPSCKRKWQGCDCRRKGSSNMICFEDARCACFQYGRECDADLCGECGVLDVLDPVHRHDDRVLQNRCHNASIQRGVPRHTILGDSGIHGLGLYACEDIQPHDFVGEYKGEIITKEEAERRGAVYEHQKLSYLFSLNKKQEVDSTLFGNKMRFINHALLKQANLYPRIIMVNTVFRIALYGARKINAGQELFFDYGDQFPQDQLGGKAGKERKAAPHVRNKNLLEHFDKVVTDTDKFGNRRARKAAYDNKRGKSAVKGSGPGSTNGSVVTRKSTVFRPSSSRGDDARSGVERSRPQRQIGDIDPDDDEKAPPQSQLDDRKFDSGQILKRYNLEHDDDDPDLNHGDDEEDDEFTPRSSDDRRFEETSSVDGGDEDDDDEGMRPAPTRSRSSRLRKFE